MHTTDIGPTIRKCRLTLLATLHALNKCIVYAPSLAEHIPTIQATLPVIKSRKDLDVTTLAVPEFNAYTGERFMSWLLDTETRELFLYYPHVGE